VAVSVELDGFSSKLEKYFALIGCMTSSIGNNIWYIDFGASFHIIGNRVYFN